MSRQSFNTDGKSTDQGEGQCGKVETVEQARMFASAFQKVIANNSTVKNSPMSVGAVNSMLECIEVLATEVERLKKELARKPHIVT
jgi:hypothetical protein